jgi:hypothetical protein
LKEYGIMKQWLVLAGFAVILSGLVGCQGPLSKKSGVDVIIEGGGKFPEFLVGRWKDAKKGWEFVFEPDGTISSAVIDSGFMAVVPSEGIATKPMRMDGKAVYELGQWKVQYSPDQRKLSVEVVVDFFHVDIGLHALEGYSTDWFVGPVSEDGTQWEAQWKSAPVYIALTPEPSELPVDPNDTIQTLLFEKVTENSN